MTLKRFGGIKADEHKAAHEQAIVRLGLEKAVLESEVEKKRRELLSIARSCELTRTELERGNEKLVEGVRRDLQDKAGQLRAFDEKIAAGGDELKYLVVKRDDLLASISEGEARLLDISDEIKRAEALKEAAEADAKKLLELRSKKEQDAIKAVQETSEARKELAVAMKELHHVGQIKISLEAEIDERTRHLDEINEIIAVQQAANRQGLDLVASFEGERKRLADKEQMIEEAKHDLVIYAKRLQKNREEAGIKSPMVFPSG